MIISLRLFKYFKINFDVSTNDTRITEYPFRSGDPNPSSLER